MKQISTILLNILQRSVQKKKDTGHGVDFPFDFKPNFDGKSMGNLLKLRDLVETKRTVGYFTWIYLTSIVSLMISIISITMKS